MTFQCRSLEAGLYCLTPHGWCIGFSCDRVDLEAYSFTGATNLRMPYSASSHPSVHALTGDITYTSVQQASVFTDAVFFTLGHLSGKETRHELGHGYLCRISNVVYGLACCTWLPAVSSSWPCRGGCCLGPWLRHW